MIRKIYSIIFAILVLSSCGNHSEKKDKQQSINKQTKNQAPFSLEITNNVKNDIFDNVFQKTKLQLKDLGGKNVQSDNDIKMIISSFFYFMKQHPEKQIFSLNDDINVFPYRIISSEDIGPSGILKKDVISNYQFILSVFKKSCSSKNIDLNKLILSVNNNEIVTELDDSSITPKVYIFK